MHLAPAAPLLQEAIDDWRWATCPRARPRPVWRARPARRARPACLVVSPQAVLTVSTPDTVQAVPTVQTVPASRLRSFDAVKPQMWGPPFLVDRVELAKFRVYSSF